MSGLLDRAARAAHDADCGCPDFSKRFENPHWDDPHYTKIAAAVMEMIADEADRRAAAECGSGDPGHYPHGMPSWPCDGCVSAQDYDAALGSFAADLRSGLPEEPSE